MRKGTLLIKHFTPAALALCLLLGACNTAKGIVEDASIACTIAGPGGSVVALAIPVAGAAVTGACAADAIAKAAIDATQPK